MRNKLTTPSYYSEEPLISFRIFCIFKQSFSLTFYSSEKTQEETSKEKTKTSQATPQKKAKAAKEET